MEFNLLHLKVFESKLLESKPLESRAGQRQKLKGNSLKEMIRNDENRGYPVGTTHLLLCQVDTDRSDATADVQQNDVCVQANQFGDGFVQNFGCPQIDLDRIKFETKDSN